MIVIARSYGQLGNRLFLYAHMIAAARHHGVSLANPSFAEYAHLFPATANDLWCRYPQVESTQPPPTQPPPTQPPPTLRRRQLVSRSIYWAANGLHHAGLKRFPFHVLRIRGEDIYDLASDEFARLARHPRHLLALGWLFRSESLFAEHADAVRDHFQIAAAQRQNVDRLISKVRGQADVVVGVHIRHGDYATFMNGRYFYSTAQYAQAMRDVADQLPGQRVAFVVCSNAKLDGSEFAGLQVHYGPGQIIEDMYSFAETDLLIGPPSTYTGWASFYGNVPLVVMDQATIKLDVAEKIVRLAA